MNQRSTKVVVLAGVFFTSTAAILIRLSTAPPLAIAANRMLFATVLLLPSLLWVEFSPRGTETRLRALRLKDVLLCISSGLFLAVHFATWISSLSYTTVAEATILVNTHPIFIVIASSLFLRERPDRTTVLLVGIAFVGSVALTLNTGGGRSSLLGNGLAVAGAVTVTGYFLIGRAVRGRVGLTHYTFIVYLTAAIALSAACLFSGIPIEGYSLRNYLLFAGLALLPTLLGHSVFNWSLRYLRPTFISIAVLAEPVYSTLLAIVIFSEIPSILTVTGGVVVIGTIAAYLKHEGAPKPARGVPLSSGG